MAGRTTREPRGPWRGALIGAGYFAQFQAEAWLRSSQARLVAVADATPGKAKVMAEKFGIPQIYESAADLLDGERPDFVDIATRPESHLELVTQAAARGAHVICQKPMAPSWNECVAMCEVCEKAGVRLLIHENWRWQPWYRETKKLLDSGRLGQALQLSFFWRTGDGRGPEPYLNQPYFKEMPRLLIYETLVHILDTFRFLQGEMESVQCQIRKLNPVLAGEDQALMQVRFQNGVLGLIDGNRITGPAPAPVAMGTLVLEGEEAALRVAPDGRIWLKPRLSLEEEHMYTIPSAGYKGDSVFATQEHLVQSLQEGEPSESDGRDYLKTVALVEAAYRSAETGRAIKGLMD